MAFPSIHDRANGGKEVSSPVRAKPVRHFPKDRAHADGLFAGVIGGGNGGIVQKEEQVVLDLGIAFLQASAMGVGGLAGETAVHTPLEITAVLIQRRGGQGVTAFVNGKRAQQHGLHAGGKHRVPCLEGKLTIPQLMGQTDLPLLGRVVLLGTVEIGDPDGGAMFAQDFLDDPVAPAGANHMHTDLRILKDPLPLGASVDPCPGFITPDQPAAAQARQDLLYPVVQTGFHPPEEIRQRPFADGHAIDLRKERRQALVTDGMGIPQIGRQTLDRGPKGRAGLHPHRHRGHIGLSTVGTLPPMLLHPGDDGLDRGNSILSYTAWGCCSWACTAPPQCGQILAWAMMTWSGSGCRGLPPPARPTLASRRGLVRGPGGRFAFGVCEGGTLELWASLRGSCGLASSAASWAFRRCTSAHSAIMRASFSSSDKRSSSGSLSMAALSGSQRAEVKKFYEGVEQLHIIYILSVGS